MIALLAACLAAAPAGAAAPPAAEYRLTLSALDAPLLEVRATVAAPDGTLHMETEGGVDQLPQRWSTFLRELHAEDEAGHALALTRLGPGEWRLPAPAARVRLRYGVDLAFTRQPWPVGNEQAGAAFDDALYLVTRPLFVTGARGPARVAFEVPREWTVSTPWTPVGNGGRTFAVPSYEALCVNSFVVGRHRELLFDQGAFRLIVALPGPMREGSTAIGAALRQSVLAAGRLFGGEENGRYLMTVFAAAQEDGEAFQDSAAFTTVGPPGPGGVPVWANTLAHEFLHHWLGGRISGDEWAPWRWLNEGFTEYLANRTLRAAGLIDERTYVAMVEKHVGLYLLSRARGGDLPSLAAAGSGRERMAVYEGGWTAALCLDTTLRESSNDARGLEDLVRALDARFGHGTRLDRAGLQAALRALGGEEAASFVDRHVSGSQDLPAGACLARLGFDLFAQDYAGMAWIAPQAEATAARQERRRRFLAGG